MKEKAIWLLALGTIVTSVGTSAIVVSALRPSPREPVTVRNAEDAGAVARELAAMRSFLEERERERLEPATVAPSARHLEGTDPTIAAGDIDRLIGAIERLELVLRDEQTATRRALVGASTGVPVADRRTEIDWEAWNELCAIYQGDEEAARERVRLLRTDDLLARFGPPTEISSRENGYRMWYYYDRGKTQPLNVQVQIVDGYVSLMWMEI